MESEAVSAPPSVGSHPNNLNPDLTYNQDNEDVTTDANEIRNLGYKPAFKRDLTLWSTFAVSFSVLGLLPSFASTLTYAMYAGTAGLTWGWLVSLTGIMAVAISMAELCSAMPTSGGLYYAAAVLAPSGWGPLASWLTGWSNWLTQITAGPSVNYGTSGMILAVASILNPDFEPKQYQKYLVTLALMLIHGAMASLPTHWIGRINNVGCAYSVLALVVVIILIPAATNREQKGLPRFSGNSQTWGTIGNFTEFPHGISTLMSFQSVVWTMSGYDSAFHMSEECVNADVNCPIAIVLSAGTAGLSGWFLSLVVAYTVVDVDAAVNTPLGQPWAGYAIQALPQNAAVAVLALTIAAGFAMGQACVTSCSRVTFAYARDDVMPLSRYWSHVNEKTKTPVNAVLIDVLLGSLLLLLILAGDVAIGALFSVGACASFAAFTIPIFLRCFFVCGRFRPGPWNLGKFSIPIGVYGCAFVALMIPIMCLPATVGKDLNAKGMNWTCVVYGGPMLIVTIVWIVYARKWYKGPLNTLEGNDEEEAEKKIDVVAGPGAAEQRPECERYTELQELPQV